MIKVKVLNYQNIYLIAPHNLAASIFNLLWFVYNSQLNLIVSQRMWWNSTRNCSYARVYLRSFNSSWKTLERLYNVWFGTQCRLRRFRQYSFEDLLLVTVSEKKTLFNLFLRTWREFCTIQHDKQILCTSLKMDSTETNLLIYIQESAIKKICFEYFWDNKYSEKGRSTIIASSLKCKQKTHLIVSFTITCPSNWDI